jgi:hypothetical protein
MKRLAAAVFVIGCGTDGPTGPELVEGLTIEDPPENGLQIITPIVEGIQPGTDNEICTWTDKFLDEVTDVRATHGFQSEPGGHHTVLYYTTFTQPPGTTRECTETDMASFRFITGNDGAGAANEAPGNLVYRIPKGAQLVLNHHYLNTTDQVLRGQAAMNVKFADPGNYTPSGSTAFLDTNIHVQEGLSTFESTCTIDRTMKMWFLIPHMHRWGTHMNVDLIRGDQTESLFDVPWDESYTFHPPELRKDPAEPMTLVPGDQMRIKCQWNNDSGKVLDFGFEMCVAFGQFVDDTEMGGFACDGGVWTPF